MIINNELSATGNLEHILIIEIDIKLNRLSENNNLSI